MALAEKHPTDEGKWQSTFDKYGHGAGNGKSRNAVYKYAKKQESRTSPKKESPKLPKSDLSETGSQSSDSENTKSGPDNEEPDFVQEFIENDTKWGSVSWADDGEDLDDIQAATIPKPIADIARGKDSRINMEATGQFVRYGYMALDRMITHWGRGVTGDTSYSLSRRPSDYDALESATVAAMAHYGIEIPISPLLVLGATVTAAYAPPIIHIQRHKDPNRRTGVVRRFFGRIGRRISAPFIRGRKKKMTQNQGGEETDESIEG